MPRPRFHALAAAKKERILAAALQEFGEHGFEQASMNRILERAALSKGAAYYYFDGKEDLFNTVVEHSFERVMAAFGSEIEPLDPERDYWEQLDALGRRLMRKMIDDPEVAELARSMSKMHEPKVMSQTVAALYAHADGMIAALIQAGQARGAVRTDLPFALLSRVVVAVLAEIDRWVLEHLDELDEEGLLAASAQAIDLVRRVASPA